MEEQDAERVQEQGSDAVIEAPEAPHAHHATGHRWFDIAIGLSVVLVSLGSLYVSLHTGHTMQALVDQNALLVRANSTPLLVWSNGNLDDSGKPGITFDLENAGTGPARIGWLELRYKGQAATGLRAYLERMGAPAQFDLTLATAPVANTMLSAGKKVSFIRYPLPTAPNDAAAWRALDAERGKIEATACYCSLLGECWTSHLRADVPQPVKSCEATGKVSING